MQNLSSSSCSSSPFSPPTPPSRLAQGVADFLDRLGFDPGDRISVCHQPVGGVFEAVVLTVDQVPDQAERWADHCVWLGANPVDVPLGPGRRGGSDDVVALRQVYADLDVEPGKMPSWEAAQELVQVISRMVGTFPTAVVMTGHGLQPRWAIDPEGFDLPTAKAVLARFGALVAREAHRLGGDVDAVYDLARVLRAPFTVNTKMPHEPVPTTVDYEPGGYPLTIEALSAALDEMNVEDVPTSEMTSVVIYDGPMYSEMESEMQERVDAWMSSTVSSIKAELKAMEGWPEGYQGEAYGKLGGWEWNQACRANRLGQLARAGWNNLTMPEAQAVFMAAAPTDSGWTTADAAEKFAVQCNRGNPAPFPESLTVERNPGTYFGPLLPFSGGGQKRDWPMRSWDDFGNAERLVDHNPDRLLWVQQAEKWAVFEGSRWELDETRAVQRMAQETIASLPTTEALRYDDTAGKDDKGKEVPSSREKFLEWVRSQRFASKVRSMVETARGLAGLSARITDFDANPWLLNCTNGVLDLRTQGLMEHDARLMQMQQANVAYEPEAQCPRWETFLEQMQPDPEVRRYLQRVVGYSLTGLISEQKMFMHLGEGANGKSVFLEVMTGLTGSYGQVIPRTTLLVKKNEQIPNDIARMVNKRFLQTSETGKGQMLDEEVVKGLTGGEMVTGRSMRAEFFDFKPTGKIHYVTNHFPRVSDAKSLWRRMVIIKWLVTISDDDPRRDRHLAAKIIAEELDGVLAWAVRGLADWQAQGLAEPTTVSRWIREYQEDADEFGDFLAECTMEMPGSFCTTQRLYEVYSAWTYRGGRGQAMSIKSFSTALKERNYTLGRGQSEDGKQMRGFRGLMPVAVHPVAPWSPGA